MNIGGIFAKNLRHYRTSRRLSQEKIAEICGLHRTSISYVEREKRSISIGNVQKITDALGIKTYKLFLEDNNDEN